MFSIKRSLSALLILLGLLAWEPANAALLFAGGEDIDFVFIGGVVVSTNSAFFRPSWAREGIQISPANNTHPNTNRVYTPAWTNQSTVWLHAQVYAGFTTTQVGTEWLCFIGSDGVCRFLLEDAGAGGTTKFVTQTSAGTRTDILTCTAGGFPIGGAVSSLDLFLNYAVSGHATLYINGVNVCDFSGNVTTDGITSISQIYLAGGSTGNDIWSEVVTSTTDTRGTDLFTCAPQANGTTQNWTGTASNVNGTTYNDTTPLTTNATNTIGNFTCPSFPAGNYTIPAVVQSARIQGAAGTITNFRFNSRPAGSGSDFDTTADIPVTGNFINYPNNIITTNPATSSAWTASALGAGVNFGVKSRP